MDLLDTKFESKGKFRKQEKQKIQMNMASKISKIWFWIKIQSIKNIEILNRVTEKNVNLINVKG